MATTKSPRKSSSTISSIITHEMIFFLLFEHHTSNTSSGKQFSHKLQMKDSRIKSPLKTSSYDQNSNITTSPDLKPKPQGPLQRKPDARSFCRQKLITKKNSSNDLSFSRSQTDMQSKKLLNLGNNRTFSNSFLDFSDDIKTNISNLDIFEFATESFTKKQVKELGQCLSMSSDISVEDFNTLLDGTNTDECFTLHLLEKENENLHKQIK